QIDREILPEIRELQAAADQVRQLPARGVTIAKEIEHQTADRIGGEACVPQKIIDRVEALKIYIAAKRTQQVGERLARNREAARGVGKRDHHGMARRSGVGKVKFALPFVKLREALFLVREVVADTRVGVN